MIRGIEPFVRHAFVYRELVCIESGVMTYLYEVVHVWRNSVNGMVSLRASRASLCREEFEQHLALNVSVAGLYVLRLSRFGRIHSVAAGIYGLYAQTQTAVARSIKLHCR